MPKMVENRTALQILMQVANIVFKNNLYNDFVSDTQSRAGMAFDKYLKRRSTLSLIKTNPIFSSYVITWRKKIFLFHI
jgi:hypothetical protein